MPDLTERFWAKVTITDGCWSWTASTQTDGYGQHKVDGRLQVVHRLAYEELVGPIPEGLQLDHLCRNRRCVNPDHLEPVTCRENLMRGNTLAAANAAKTHCVNGHEFTPENTYVPPGRPDRRDCRLCRAEATARYRARKAA